MDEAERPLSPFDALVAQALDELPEWVRQRMENVAVLTADWPTAEQTRSVERRPGGRRGLLLGLYEGVPLTHRGHGYHLASPDRITLFRGPLMTYAHNAAELRQLVRQTVIHEIGHHFGLSEEELRRLGT